MFSMWRATKVVAHKTGLPRRTVLLFFVQASLVAHGIGVWNPERDEETLRAITIALGLDWTEAKVKLGWSAQVVVPDDGQTG